MTRGRPGMENETAQHGRESQEPEFSGSRSDLLIWKRDSRATGVTRQIQDHRLGKDVFSTLCPKFRFGTLK